MNLESQINEYIRKRHYRQINSVLVFKDNTLIAQCYYNNYDENTRNPIKSIAKSIMSIAMGIALDKGLILSLDEPISKYIPEFNEGRDPFHKMITVKHLLTMTSGIFWNGGIHYHCPMLMQMHRSGNWISHIADCAVVNRPGTKYNYKEWDVILLAKILDVICGDLFDFINEHLYKSLEIKSERWYKSSCGTYYSVAQGDEGMEESKSNLSARDLLKIGRLFLQDGIYKDKVVISKDYIKQATTPIAINHEYGYLWWCGEAWYSCRGYGGQHILVIPKQNMVIVTQATPTSRGMSYDDVVWFCKNCSLQ